MMLAIRAAAREQDQQNEEQPQPPAATQRLFVSDKLVLNVYAEADQGSERVATIETGEIVEALDRSNNFVRVRLEDGREGWVGANYLTSNAPAATRLRELERAQKSGLQTGKKSADEIARLKKETATLQAQVNELKARAASAPVPSADNTQSTPADSASEAQERHDPQPVAVAPVTVSGASWMWPFIVVLGAGLGFAAGYRTLAGRIRKKFGGLRIY